MSQRIKGILFDLGDTLVDFGHLKTGKLFRAGSLLAYEYLKNLGKKIPGKWWYCFRQKYAIRLNYLKSKFTRREFNSLELLMDLAEEMGCTLSHDEAMDVATLFYKPVTTQARTEPGLAELLGRLRQSNLTLGIVSNTFIPGEVLDRHLEQLNLLQHLPHRVYSVDSGIRKPDKRIFANALNKAGLLPQETLFVGDMYRKDVRGSNRAGMNSVLIRKNQKGRLLFFRRKADHVISRLAELEPLVASYNDHS